MAAALQTNIKFPAATFGALTKQSSHAPFRVRCVAVNSAGKKRYNITLLPGDGIGPEVISIAKNVLKQAGSLEGLEFSFKEMHVGGAALDLVGVPLPEETVSAAKESDAVLLGAIGGYKWDKNEKHLKPETGLLQLRAALKVFANLRPATVLPQLVDASTLKREVAEGVDLMVVRELTGGIYFGVPRGIKTNENGEEVGYNTEVYAAHEIDRIARVAFETARKRRGKLCSVDKANVLDASILWRRRVTALAAEYPDVELSHMYVDNAAMQLVRDPKQFDTIVTNNIFGDILSDEASMITGSIGMLPSASLSDSGPGLFEPIHGSAPDIAGQDKANPLATILSAAMLLKYGLGEEKAAKRIEDAVLGALNKGFRTGDIYSAGTKLVGCKEMGEEVLKSVAGPALASSMKKKPGAGSLFSSSPRSSGSDSLISSMAACALSVKTFTLSELEKATDKFSSKRVLGEGGFGRVYQGSMEDGTEIAVKLLTRDNQNRDREFIAEVEMLSRLHHRNLVKLIGICIEGRTRCLIYELVHNGSVESHLHEGTLDWDARLKIALGAARGLAYLHEDSNPRVIHRDFKASNVLLEDDFTPKVSDFGLAREATEGSQHISTRVMGTFGYVAPEYAMTGHLLVKSDVYSYGVVLLELLTGRRPVDMSQPSGEENLVTWARPLLANREGLEQLVDPTLAGTYDFDDMAKVAAIASMCVHQEVSHRPFMGEVVQALKLIYNDADETCGGDYCSQKESSLPDFADFKGDLAPSDSSWWNLTPRLRYGQASTFITMDYSSGPLEEMENRLHSASNIPREGGLFLENRSGPLRPARSRRNFFRSRGSMSEHGGPSSSRHLWSGNGDWF